MLTVKLMLEISGYLFILFIIIKLCLYAVKRRTILNNAKEITDMIDDHFKNNLNQNSKTEDFILNYIRLYIKYLYERRINAKRLEKYRLLKLLKGCFKIPNIFKACYSFEDYFFELDLNSEFQSNT